jgi:hypothetical protein
MTEAKSRFQFICVHGIENSSKDKRSLCAVICYTCGHKCGLHVFHKSSVIEDEDFVCVACEEFDEESCKDFQPSSL